MANITRTITGESVCVHAKASTPVEGAFSDGYRRPKFVVVIDGDYNMTAHYSGRTPAASDVFEVMEFISKNFNSIPTAVWTEKSMGGAQYACCKWNGLKWSMGVSNTGKLSFRGDDGIPANVFSTLADTVREWL